MNLFNKTISTLLFLLSIQSAFSQRNFFRLMENESSYTCTCITSKKKLEFDIVFWISDTPNSLNGKLVYPFYFGRDSFFPDTTGYLYLTADNELYFEEELDKIFSIDDSSYVSGLCSGRYVMTGSFGYDNLFGDMCNPHLFISFNPKNYMRYNYVHNIGEFIISQFHRRIFPNGCDFSDNKNFVFEYKLSNLLVDNRPSSYWRSAEFLSLMNVNFDYGIQEMELQTFEGLKYKCKKRIDGK